MDNPHNHLLRRLGLSQAFEHTAIQYNSIIFRVVIGVLSEDLRAAVAIVTAIEFTLNAVMEVPGGWVSDRIGRFRSLAVGNLLIASAYLAMFFAFIFQSSPEIAIPLVIIDGILLGLGKPLISGSLEAFYQHALAKVARSPDEIKDTLTLSAKYGRWLPPAMAVIVFPLLYFLDQLSLISIALLIGVFLRLWIIWRLRSDHREIGDIDVGVEAPLGAKDLIRSFARSPRLKIATILHLSNFIASAAIMGYLIVSLGNSPLLARIEVLGFSPKWFAMPLFMLGYLSLGWLGHSFISPLLITKLSERAYISLYVGLIVFASFFQAQLLDISALAFVATIFVYGALFAWTSSAIRSLCGNIVLSEFGKADFASALSWLNIPAFILVGAHSAYVLFALSGVPSLWFSFYTVIAIFGLSAATILLSGLWKNLRE